MIRLVKIARYMNPANNSLPDATEFMLFDPITMPKTALYKISWHQGYSVKWSSAGVLQTIINYFYRNNVGFMNCTQRDYYANTNGKSTIFTGFILARFNEGDKLKINNFIDMTSGTVEFENFINGYLTVEEFEE